MQGCFYPLVFCYITAGKCHYDITQLVADYPQLHRMLVCDVPPKSMQGSYGLVTSLSATFHEPAGKLQRSRQEEMVFHVND